VVGFDEIVANKYLPCIAEAIARGDLESYAVIDLISQQSTIEARLVAAAVQPSKTIYLPDGEAFDPEAQMRAIDRAVGAVATPGRQIKMYIATEVRAHLPYLRYCVDNGITALVEKPVLAPLEGNRFAPEAITDHMRSLISAAEVGGCSVMTLSRYHRIYNDTLMEAVRERMMRWGTPLTSLHLRAAGGVWNLQQEFASRDDHPYRYGYGMLMHGAYHYIDLAVQFLALNVDLFPDQRFALELSSFSAGPTDQYQRITGTYAAALGDDGPRLPPLPDAEGWYGETDVTASFRLTDADTGRVITLGTLSFEQTTPSIRTWPEIPDGLYNKNGRTSAVELEAQIGTLYAVNVHCYDIPRGEGADRIDAFARVTERANAALVPGEDYVKSTTFDGLFHSDSNRALMRHWLAGTEKRSSLSSHLLPMRVTEALARSVHRPGHALTVTDFTGPAAPLTALPACGLTDAPAGAR
jgi:predicted dehydrogenase